MCINSLFSQNSKDYFFMFITSNSSSAFLITCSNLSNCTYHYYSENNLSTVDSGYNEPAFSELPAIVNATLGIRMFSHKTNTFFIRL
jgi:hypothetical protein